MWIQFTIFSKNWNQRSMTPKWPLTSLLLKSYVASTWGSLCPYPMGVHQCMWIQWSSLQIWPHSICRHVILHHTHTHPDRMSDHIVSFWTIFGWDKKFNLPTHPFASLFQIQIWSLQISVIILSTIITLNLPKWSLDTSSSDKICKVNIETTVSKSNQTVLCHYHSSHLATVQSFLQFPYGHFL